MQPLKAIGRIAGSAAAADGSCFIVHDGGSLQGQRWDFPAC
jgi:hypothetical protein